jgi:formate dehydrogenase subunit gamma
VTEDKLFEALAATSGRGPRLDPRSQGAGPDQARQQGLGRYLHGHRQGAVDLAIVGILAVLAIFYLYRADQDRRRRSGRTILRFNAIERFAHWLMAPPSSCWR